MHSGKHQGWLAGFCSTACQQQLTPLPHLTCLRTHPCACLPQGVMPLFISPTTGNFTARRVSFGALGDSYYEYLLKMWLIKGRQDEMYRSMWERVSVYRLWGRRMHALWPPTLQTPCLLCCWQGALLMLALPGAAPAAGDG